MPHTPARGRVFAALTALTLLAQPAGAAGSDDIVVFGAASLTQALGAIGDAWTADTGDGVSLSFAGSSILARQIQQGAPADIFVSASVAWMDALAGSRDIDPATRRDLLGNALVLIGHGADAPPVTIDTGLDLAGMLGDGRLAMALVDAVPAGVYGKDALTTLGLWDSVAPQVVQADNVRAALAFVARNEAPFGIVYATDAAVADDVTVIGTFPAGSHDPITYPAAITAQSTHPQAQAFLNYLSSDAANAIWRRYGFTVRD